jgi:hypothetical protein
MKGSDSTYTLIGMWSNTFFSDWGVWVVLESRDGHADVERLPIRKMQRYDIRIDAHRQKYPHGQWYS